MTTELNKTASKTVADAVDEYTLHHACAQSLSCILSDIAEAAHFDCDLEINDPWHPAQKLHACITSIQHQLATMHATVYAIAELADGEITYLEN